ncbi:MAG: AAA domain-containing protein [Sulfobacillus thermotolerans]|nr:AAA domain-containing protein [Sulfobacillus thermotolerans]
MNTIIPEQNTTTLRRQIVTEARQKWQEKLFDLGRRNNLLYYRDLKTGSLRFDPVNAQFIDQLFGDEAFDLTEYLANREDDLKKLRTISDKAQSNFEEKGMATAYLAAGLATWRTSDSGRDPVAPIWLVPIQLESDGLLHMKYRIMRTGEIRVNPILLHVLRKDFGVVLNDEDLPANWEALKRQGQAIQQQAHEVPGFTVQDIAILGNFSFQKMAMVEDLNELGEALIENDLVAALAGDPDAITRLFAGGSPADMAELDQIPPDDEFTLLDADSSQQQVIRTVIQGRSGVILGPPGTGKSQTIVNIIAEYAARGKSVLFVAEKRAALDVVLGRLKDVGLDYLALDLQAAEQSKKMIANQLGSSLNRIRNAEPVESNGLHQRLVERRNRLNRYVEKLHRSREPFQMSLYRLQGELLMNSGPRVGTRWTASALERWTPESKAHAEEQLKELAGLQSITTSSWAQARFVTVEEVATTLAIVQNLRDRLWPEFRSRAIWIENREYGQVRTLQDIDRMLTLFPQIAELQTLYRSEVYALDLQEMASALEPARRGVFSAFVHRLTDTRFKDALKTLAQYRIAGAVQPDDVERLIDQQAQWLERGSQGIPRVPDDHQVHLALWAEVRDALNHLTRLGLPIWDHDWHGWESMLHALADDRVTPHRMVRAHQLREALQGANMGPLLDELENRQIPAEEWRQAFRYAVYSSAVDHILSGDPELGAFTRENHERVIEEFRSDDQDRLHIARLRVSRHHASAAITMLNAFGQEEQLVRQESQKKSRHLSLRKFLQRAPHALLALRPCWVGSPLSVSQLLPAQTLFDLVLFDEGSQVLPEDAIAAIARGKQTVIAGDNHQLPPTPFFASTPEDIEDDEALPFEGYESVLDLMSGMTSPWWLRWHYRSRDERLIAFSNHHIYGNSLITFPGRGHDQPVRHVLVPQTAGTDQDAQSVAAEAERVVQLILSHAKERPQDSLGVITMGIKHAERIQMALDAALRSHSDLADFFDAHKPEHFFVKNLERVQGDERDAVILSIGYGKDRSGTLPYRFGPLLHNGGERRLNVAITRARKTLTVVSSFDSRDMDPERKMSRGVELLRAFLEYAESHGDRLEREDNHDDVPLNPFELAVRDALTAKGLALVPQWGVSRYRLDFAVKHPKRPGEFVLAIECDGASYHAAPTARDRDRLRQQQLEALGWRFHRIWSTEWFRNPGGEVERVLRAYQAAITAADTSTSHLGPIIEKSVQMPVKAMTPQGPPPKVTPGLSIDQRGDEELVQLIAWLESDGRLRTNEELVKELMSLLGYKRRGPRIDTRLHGAINQWRDRVSTTPPSGA